MRLIYLGLLLICVKVFWGILFTISNVIFLKINELFIFGFTGPLLLRVNFSLVVERGTP